jgi:hypothetical protein
MQACVRLLLYGYMLVLPFACVSTCFRKCAKKPVLFANASFVPYVLSACFGDSALKKINEAVSLRSA